MLPPSSSFEAHESFRSPRLLAKVLSGLLVLDLAATLVTASFLLDGLGVGRALMAGHAVPPDALELLEQRAQQIEAFSLGLRCLCAIMFLTWTYRVASNVRGRIDFAPGWAVGSYFIPLVNIVKPYLSLAEIWDASDPDPTADPSTPRSHRLLLAWWLIWVASNIVTAAVSRAPEPQTYEHWIIQLYIRFIPLAGHAIATALALAVVWKLTGRQVARANALMPSARIAEA